VAIIRQRQFEQWEENTIGDIVAAIISIEQANPGLIDQGIYVIDDIRLKPGRPHPATEARKISATAAAKYEMAA